MKKWNITFRNFKVFPLLKEGYKHFWSIEFPGAFSTLVFLKTISQNSDYVWRILTVVGSNVLENSESRNQIPSFEGKKNIYFVCKHHTRKYICIKLGNIGMEKKPQIDSRPAHLRSKVYFFKQKIFKTSSHTYSYVKNFGLLCCTIYKF